MTINGGVEREAGKSFKGHQKVGGISFFIFGWSPTIMQISLQEKILNDVSFFPGEQGEVGLNARNFRLSVLPLPTRRRKLASFPCFSFIISHFSKLTLVSLLRQGARGKKEERLFLVRMITIICLYLPRHLCPCPLDLTTDGKKEPHLLTLYIHRRWFY